MEDGEMGGMQKEAPHQLTKTAKEEVNLTEQLNPEREIYKDHFSSSSYTIPRARLTQCLPLPRSFYNMGRKKTSCRDGGLTEGAPDFAGREGDVTCTRKDAAKQI